MASPFLPIRWVVNTPDLSGLANVFPRLPGQTFKTLKTPKWSTGVQNSASGRATVAAYFTYPLWRFKLDYDLIRNKPPTYNELVRLLAFFNSQRGQFGEWYYFDPDDNLVTNQAFGTGDGTTRAFQLMRSMIDGALRFDEPIYGLNGIPTVMVNGVATTAYVDEGSGVIQFNVAPAARAVLTWSGSFFFVCRFTVDELQLQQDYSRIWSLSELEWISKKP